MTQSVARVKGSNIIVNAESGPAKDHSQSKTTVNINMSRRRCSHYAAPGMLARSSHLDSHVLTGLRYGLNRELMGLAIGGQEAPIASRDPVTGPVTAPSQPSAQPEESDSGDHEVAWNPLATSGQSTVEPPVTAFQYGALQPEKAAHAWNPLAPRSRPTSPPPTNWMGVPPAAAPSRPTPLDIPSPQTNASDRSARTQGQGSTRQPRAVSEDANVYDNREWPEWHMHQTDEEHFGHVYTNPEDLDLPNVPIPRPPTRENAYATHQWPPWHMHETDEEHFGVHTDTNPADLPSPPRTEVRAPSPPVPEPPAAAEGPPPTAEELLNRMAEHVVRHMHSMHQPAVAAPAPAVPTPSPAMPDEWSFGSAAAQVRLQREAEARAAQRHAAAGHTRESGAVSAEEHAAELARIDARTRDPAYQAQARAQMEAQEQQVREHNDATAPGAEADSAARLAHARAEGLLETDSEDPETFAGEEVREAREAPAYPGSDTTEAPSHRAMPDSSPPQADEWTFERAHAAYMAERDADVPRRRSPPRRRSIESDSVHNSGRTRSRSPVRGWTFESNRENQSRRRQ